MNSKSILLVSAGCCVLAALTSCRKENMPPDVATTESVALTQSEIYKREFLRLVVSSNMTVDATETDVNKLCNDIDKAVDSKEAVCLFDKLGEMAINQYVSETNYYCRQNWYLQLWYVTLNAFVFAQHHRQESFEDWDRLFKFFKKYTDEIADVEATLASPKKLGTVRRMNMEGYLRGIKGDLKQNVHVMRRFFFPTIVDGLTEDQKADIMRRFREVEGFTSRTPDSPDDRK